jgi:hypothetical protein
MAALQERNGSFRLIFLYHGKQRTFTIGEVSEEANDTGATVGSLPRRVEEGSVNIPDGLAWGLPIRPFKPKAFDFGKNALL